MRRIDPAAALEELERRREAGFHVDSRLVREVRQSGELFLLALSTQEHFLRLVWQSVDGTRPLTPVGSPRTLQDCATRLQAFGWSFRHLSFSGYAWFERCTRIDEEFVYARFGWIAVVPMNEHEQRETPLGAYYIYDGVHKAIVLAKKLLQRELEYQPLEALLLTPRR